MDPILKDFRHRRSIVDEAVCNQLCLGQTCFLSSPRGAGELIRRAFQKEEVAAGSLSLQPKTENHSLAGMFPAQIDSRTALMWQRLCGRRPIANL